MLLIYFVFDVWFDDYFLQFMACQDMNFDPERERIELRYKNSPLRDYVFPRFRLSLDSTPEVSIEHVTTYNLKIQNKIKPPP